MSNKTTIGDKFRTYLKHPGSFIVMLLVMLSAIITFAVLIFLIAYILINGLPHITPSLFSLEYSSENASVVPALVNTIVMTLLSLLIAVPFGIFSAIFLVEYAARGNKFVEVIRLTTETLSGIPSIVYGLFGMLFFVNALGWGFSLLAGAFTMAIMILPLIMRTTEEALKAVPDSFREGHLVRNIGPGLSVVHGTDCPIMVVTIFVKVNIERVVDKQGRRPFSPIITRNGSRHFSGETLSDVFASGDTQIFLRWIGVFILHNHDKVIILPIFNDGGVYYTKIWIKEHLCFGEILEILCSDVINAMIQSLFAFTGRHLLVTSGNGSSPKDIEGLRRFVIEQFRCPAVMRSGFMHHHGDGILFAPMNQIF